MFMLLTVTPKQNNHQFYIIVLQPKCKGKQF